MKSKNSLNSFNIRTNNIKLANFIKKYCIQYVTEAFDISQNSLIIKNFLKSEVIIIDRCADNDQKNEFFVIGFNEIILIIEQNYISSLISIFSTNEDSIIYFLPNTKDFFNQKILIKNQQIEFSFIEEINNFSAFLFFTQQSESIIPKLYESVSKCITGYLIQYSYSKLIKKQNIIFLSDNLVSENKYYENDFIKIKDIGSGSSSNVDLVYNIEKIELYALKKSYGNESENAKLYEREYKNYSMINYPLLPKFYGKINNFLLMQYIKGNTLFEIKKHHFSEEDKIIIIFQMMLIIKYLHDNNFVYRDLKPDNVIVDENKTAFIIDFDRMISITDLYENQIHTLDMQTTYASPEIFSGIISFKNDIYSLGRMIYYIINEIEPDSKSDSSKICNFIELTKIQSIYKRCTLLEYNQRPSIYELIFEFYIIFSSQIKQSNLQIFPEVKYFDKFINNPKDLSGKDIEQAIEYLSYKSIQYYPKMQYNLGQIYDYIKQEINKAIEYYTIAADQDQPQAKFRLGIIYFCHEHIKQDISKVIYYLTPFANKKNPKILYLLVDINKSIEYLTESANQNFAEAQYYLGILYIRSSYIDHDVNKSIHYLKLAADQNHSNALNELGCLYDDNIHIKKDLQKAIHYWTLAANQNHAEAQYNLGTIYASESTIRDINKAINYLTLSVNNNFPEAQFNLGLIYFYKKYNNQNISKAIYYFTQLADQNDPQSQYFLGVIYSNSEYTTPNINKAIKYLKKSANQNFVHAQYYLGALYMISPYIEHDINKAISYLTLAADQNHSNAQFLLGDLYSDFLYDKYDRSKAIYYLTLSANQHNSDAQLELGYLLLLINEYEKAIHYITLAADQNNNPNAQYLLAQHYILGKYIKRDPNKAIFYLKRAADNNIEKAQLFIALEYMNGQYVHKDINKAIYYLILAANKNNNEAQFHLGDLYYCIDRNISKALYYLTLSADQNNLDALYKLGMIYIVDENIYVRDIKKAIHYLSIAANKNHCLAQFNLGIIYKDGILTQIDINKAIHYLTLASNNHFAEAQFNLAVIYYEGLYKQLDINKAIHYLTLACNQNYPDAQYVLGVFYFKGKFINKDINKAIHYITLAANQNHAKAQFSLGLIYYHGINIKKDIKKSFYYLNLSANQKYSEAQLFLGLLYKDQNDFDKFIYYITLAANQNNSFALYTLAILYLSSEINNADPIKGIDFLFRSSSIKHNIVDFQIGYCYHEGAYINRDISKMMHYYKKASSFNSEYAKNNLGFIFKKGIGTEIEKNVGFAMVYFDEAIRRFNNEVSMYNLSHIYIYEFQTKKDIEKAIDLLIQSSNKNFEASKELLCIALILKNGFDISRIKQDLYDQTEQTSNLPIEICLKINELKLLDENIFNELYQYYKNVDFLYNFWLSPITQDQFDELNFRNRWNKYKIAQKINAKIKNITSEFYDGFGTDIQLFI